MTAKAHTRIRCAGGGSWVASPADGHVLEVYNVLAAKTGPCGWTGRRRTYRISGEPVIFDRELPCPWCGGRVELLAGATP
jgi:hypothetical protein